MKKINAAEIGSLKYKLRGVKASPLTEALRKMQVGEALVVEPHEVKTSFNVTLNANKDEHKRFTSRTLENGGKVVMCVAA